MREAGTDIAVESRGLKVSARRAAVEFAVGYALILAVIWTPRPLQRWLWVLAAVGIAVLIWRSFPGWRAMGFTAANFVRSLWIVGVALALAAAAIAIAAHLHTLHLPPGGPMAFIGTYIAYAIWTGVQQFLLQGFFLPRLERINFRFRAGASRAWVAALGAALLFAAAHLPNPILTPATFLLGFASCLLFQRYRNIYPLMIAHAILGITVAICVPGPVVHNMRVGLGYLRYSPPMHRHGHRFAPSAQP
jgi:membrane protease YdiL (CAAX protease family)